MRLIFNALNSLSDEAFDSMCDSFIANARSAPMLKDFADFIGDEEKARHKNDTIGYLEMLREAEKNNKMADPEFVRMCIQTIEAKLTGKMSRDQFWVEALPLIEKAAGVNE